ncbi:ferredoxin [Saccharomonospora cyanea]|uniref:Ferredoxin n=1 Tax=Saccharomonospora cyanea NA-134 TaxID=882082 RepID=H5XL66_9PSEU|nr:(4Fe-4S)-binding protein [Saccharomonospora cyanea]EHR63574.1 ferredoxin [Saccharomonospora cyanea NA-134]
MRIVADTERCVGAGQCVLSEPAVFDQREDDGTVVVLVDRPDGEELDNTRQAVEICPSQALSLVEE